MCKSNDLISRQAAIDAIEKYLDKFDCIDANFLDGLKTTKKILNDLPSAQPKQRWIPVSKRLPDDGLYLVTTSKGQVQVHVFSRNGNSEEYWIRCNKAWMPLPEPYTEKWEQEMSDYRWQRIMAYKDGYEQGRFDEKVEIELCLPKWILCSERLPDNGDIVIVSIRDETGDTKFNYSSYGWITTNKEYWIVDNEINNYVVAWMPLPDAYEEEENG